MEGLATWENFSTATVLPAQRIHRWNDFGSETFCNMTVDPVDRSQFNASLSRVECGPLGIVAMRSTGAKASGGLLGINGWATSEHDALTLVHIEEGHCSALQGNLAMEAHPGDLFFQDLTRTWHFASDGPMSMFMLKIPFSALLPTVEDPTRLLGTVYDSRDPLNGMAADVIKLVHRALRGGTSRAMEGALTNLVFDAVNVLYQNRKRAPDEDSDQQKHAVLRRAAKNYIVKRLDDPSLTTGDIASALGVSLRRLQRIFLENGETPIQFILGQRLDAAARMLSEAPKSARNSVLDIALSVGFNDASHFSRSFAKRFGLSPRHYRGSPSVKTGASVAKAQD